jgi:hypothetical protein
MTRGFTWSGDSQSIYYAYTPDNTSFSNLSIYIYEINDGESIKLVENYWSFGVQGPGFSEDLDILRTPIPSITPTSTPRPTRTPDPSCIKIGDTFSAPEDPALRAYLDIVGGSSRKLSENSVEISIELRDLPENITNLILSKYQILILDGSYQPKILIEVQESESGNFVSTYKGIEYYSFIKRGFGDLEINTSENTFTVTISNVDYYGDEIPPDGILGIFSVAPNEGDAVTCAGITRP